MHTTQQLSISLPNDLVEEVKARVRAGEYASDSEVIREGLRTLLARDREPFKPLFNARLLGKALQAAHILSNSSSATHRQQLIVSNYLELRQAA
ncbi:ribbon-helix-helix domain-containing protein [Halochromatium roseum]|uniref:ribbon-helix-helix domain-containing protein n=1 Tax=Halochromatium roseum TaxID=391920 RepID=UPI001914787B|nr:ribbon-helix-helix domain-containing protein [Halochromatium roseum]MBK5939465.1 hypothetical protein [Halochromatium roseum]